MPEIQIDDSFLSNILETESGCWEWQGRRNDKGYGRVAMFGCHMPTHRLSLVLKTGEDKPGLVTRHKCDNPPCINPDHLQWGTNAENLADRKGMKYVKSTPPKEFCKRGHSSEKSRNDFGTCDTCTHLRYIARKLNAGGKISRVNQKRLDFLEIKLDDINIQEYL
jgi:hypothetical protein